MSELWNQRDAELGKHAAKFRQHNSGLRRVTPRTDEELLAHQHDRERVGNYGKIIRQHGSIRIDQP